jgi:glycosyltransferase involved in cell wall biosynthesis
MKISEGRNKQAALYVLGTLYPHFTGGMEIFNYYFLNHQLENPENSIFYLGESPTNSSNGHFIHLKKRWPQRFFYPLQFFFAVLRLRKKLDFAFLCFAEQSWIIPFAHSLILRFFNIPYVVTIHWGKEPSWRFRYPYVYFFRHAHAVIGVSEPICIAFKKAVPAQTFKYIPPLIPFQRAETEKDVLKGGLGYSGQERILLYVGSLKPMKNPDKIIEAFRIVGPSFLKSRGIRLILAGKGEMENELKEKVEKYELGNYIRFEGLVVREKIPDYYKAADCYVISSDYEGTSLSLMEAMFNGLPIIGSNGPGINHMLQHEQNALLYETYNTEELAETFIRIFTDQPLAAKLSTKALADFNRLYSYESMIKKYESVFLSVGTG